MNTTARILRGVVAAAVMLAAALVGAEPAPNDPGPLPFRAGAGPASGAPAGDKRAQADDLLRRARQAMEQNDLQAASQLIEQAEALGVDYHPLYLGDTPAKARRELERRLKANPQGGHAAQGANARGSSAGPVDPFAGFGVGQAGSSDPKTLAKSYILRARNELREGNLEAAWFWQRKAAEQPAVFGPGEDSPQKLALDLQHAAAGQPGGKPAGMGAPGGSGPSDAGVRRVPPVDQATVIPSPTMQRGSLGPHGPAGGGAVSAAEVQAAQSLLLEARKALAVGDSRRAASLAERARAMNVPFGPVDNPEKVLATVASYNDLMSQRSDRGQSESWRRQYARVLLEQAEALVRWNELDEAERLATEASRLRVVYSPYEPRPEQLLEHIANLRQQARRAGGGVIPAGAEYAVPAGGAGAFDRRAASAVYDPASDTTRNILAGASAPQGPLGVRISPEAAPPTQPGMGMALFQQGEAALKARDPQAALQLFRQAYAHIHELDPVTAQRLRDYLQMLPPAVEPPRQPGPTSPIDEAAARQQVLAKQMAADVAQAISNARRLLESDPKAAVAQLEQMRTKVEGSGLEPAVRDRMLRQLERELAETQKFIQQNRPRIEMEERNQKVAQNIERQQQNKLEIQNKLAQKVEEFNTLMHEQRYAEAELVAKQAAELDPDNPLAHQLVLNARLVRRMAEGRTLRDQKEQAVLDTLAEVDRASVPFSGAEPYVFPDAKTWRELTDRRAKFAKEVGRRRSEKEVEIFRKLKTPVALKFENAPLSKVVDYLAKLAELNIYLDPQGLAEEGVSTDTPITIDLQQEVKLESALKLILPPLHLTYVVKDEVLKITSEQARNTELIVVTYNVADLVIPIPNFMPSAGMGLEGAYRNAMATATVGLQGASPFGASPMAPAVVLASRDGKPATGVLDPAVLAQMSNSTSRGPTPTNMPLATGPGGAGGAALADFDSLIDLIVSTIQPTTWDEVGGPGSIREFPTNLSLVISQTQEVHEEIADLLEQLRRMQDLQVTIEVRFITLNDNFFERIGVDFDFDVVDGIEHPGMIFGRKVTSDDPVTGTPGIRDLLDHARDPTSATVGLSQPGVFSADLDIPFTQNSYTLAVPQFGGFDATAGAQLGFAILSDIEAFFFINAAQGDRRSNVLQAPKVTLFNGSTAMVSDTSSSPFVISVIPVVGDFAAAQQPVIAVLNEGTFLSVQAVVSNDRRFVRLTVVPFFSQIDKVDTFQFTGSETTTTDESAEGVQDKPNDNTKKASKKETRREGTTVQLPTFSYITVTTTVSVPDGGTVLLGGIKRLSEGRNEFGVPILNKIPYINRLFKNVGIGRETQSLMMMVTPRIIIQEEEEERLGIQASP